MNTSKLGMQRACPLPPNGLKHTPVLDQLRFPRQVIARSLVDVCGPDSVAREGSLFGDPRTWECRVMTPRPKPRRNSHWLIIRD